MIEHIVLFKAKPGASRKALQAMEEALLRLKGEVPGIVDLSVGVNFSDRSQGHTHGLVVRFRDRNALGAYQVHPAHQEVVVNHVRPNTDAVLAVDYEF